MDITLEYLIKQLSEYLPHQKPNTQTLVTSGKHYTGWLKERLKPDSQVLINAIICSSSEMRDRLEMIIYHIKKEFEGFAGVKSLPFPYDDLTQMKAIVEGLIDHFHSNISAEEVIQTLGDSSSRQREKSGYIILTVVYITVIV